MSRDCNLRIAYLSGPVDAEAVYSAWLNKRRPAYFGTSYLSQYYSVCAEIAAEGYVITTLPGAYKKISQGQFVIENRPIPTNVRGLFYHLAICLLLLRLLWSLMRYRPDVLIVTALQNYWFLLLPLRWLGVSIVASIHCTLWPKFSPLRFSWRLLLYANRLFFFKNVKAIMAVSEDVADQVRTLLYGKKIPISVFIPTYERRQFADFASPPRTPPFRIFFAGRIERNKGVFDLVEVANRLRQSGRHEFVFDLCGEGSELSTLRELANELGFTHSFLCYGFCNTAKYREILERAYLVIVPTTTNFEEGYNKVCAEAVLATRPLITSAVCPALANVRDAAIEVSPDSVDEYYNAIIELCDNYLLYEKKRDACAKLQEQFYDQSNGWGAHFRRILLQITEKARVN